MSGFVIMIALWLFFGGLGIVILSRLIAGIKYFLIARQQSNSGKLKEAKVTIMNALAWLVLILVSAYFVFFVLFVPEE